MRLFLCKSCGQTLFFENNTCGRCGHALGFSADTLSLLTLETREAGFQSLGGGELYSYCRNAAHGVCNWLVPKAVTDPDGLCIACRHNQTIPDLTIDENLTAWRVTEIAKHRLFYSLLRLKLPLKNLADAPVQGFAFNFLSDTPGLGPRILTGHNEGLITINLKEADDAMRERFRTEMGEPYRTLLGHFRHEIGHYYWNLLVRDGGRLQACRAVFGDDMLDYDEALQAHYKQGPPPEWEQNYISAYASSHPWEDFAESWAHYLHIADTLETASAFGLGIHPYRMDENLLHADINFDPYKAKTVSQLIQAWLPLTFAMNALNRSMGHADLYPFVLSETVIGKLSFIHRLVQEQIGGEA